MLWLGEKRGSLADWTTQRWVAATGRHLLLRDYRWLDGPIGNTRFVGDNFFTDYASHHNLKPVEDEPRGLLPDFHLLEEGNPQLKQVVQPVREFYEKTSAYELDAWSEWRAPYRMFGRALSLLFSKRLQQLNVPLSSLDSAKGMSSDVLALTNPATGKIEETAWVRKLHGTGNTLYAGSYSLVRIPGHYAPCVKVVFPLPNGNAIVIMKPVAHSDGSLSVQSVGESFADPGFYFVVHHGSGRISVRYLASMKEIIHVYPAEGGVVRADHVLWLWGREFLRLHYRMRRSSL